MNHGQCQYCPAIGDIEKCLKQTCFIHDNWIVKYYQERIGKQRDDLLKIIETFAQYIKGDKDGSNR